MTVKPAPARLGRGLAALMGDPSPRPDPASQDSRAIPIASLEPNPFQPRIAMDPAALDELTQSIKERGILQPLLLRPHPEDPARYQIIAGERRWRAAQAAGLHEVPALVLPLSDRDALAAALVENLQRQDLNSIEEAEGFRRLLDEFGLTQEQLAEAVGKSRSHIGNTLRLLRLPPSVQAALRGGQLSAGHARALLTLADPEAAARTVIERGLNVRQTEALAQQRPDPEPRGRDPATEALARELSDRLGLKVDIAFDGTRGSVRIYYRDLDQLDGVIRLLNPQ
jgi:ParB family chromosome partitioning protein